MKRAKPRASKAATKPRSASGRAKAPRLSKARAAFAKQLIEECGGRPLGPTLTALLEVAPYTDHFGLFADELADFGQATRTYREDLAKENGIIGLGRASLNHFGVIASRLASTIDGSPIAYVDRHGGDAFVAAPDLATFLRIVHFDPDFVGLRDVSADDAEQRHAERRDGLTPERKRAWDKLTAIPGVRPLASGAELAALCEFVAPLETAVASASLSDDELEERASELFRNRVGNSKLLIDVESVTVDDDDVAVEIGVNAARDRLKPVVAHRVVQEPLTRFLADLQAAAPGKEVTVRYKPVPPENRRDRDRSLRLALHLAGAQDLIQTFGL